ncbi:MAG: serine hydrolase, partial [Chloroflexota bacterium]|nr:serine hydrolase [Chloroflexota bacterium]
TTLQVVRFSNLRTNYPQKLEIAGVPVGGLNRQETAQRLLETYSLPVEMRYGDSVIHMPPSVAGFELDMESMLAAADLERTKQPFWAAFWDFLWGRKAQAASIPLRATYSETRLRTYLEEEVAPRYDKPPISAHPQAGTVNFEPASYGTELNIEQAVLSIERALYSHKDRSATLPKKQTNPSRPSLQNLEVLLKQTITNVNEFEGTVGLYLFHLDTLEEIHFAFQNGIEIPVNPDVAFTTASIVKIPIMVSVFRRIEENEDPEALNLLQKMIIDSGNDPADWVMERVINPDLGPIMVTEDMQALGLENTFLAGEFSIGSPLLRKYDTPANQRADVNTDPDLYNQSTSSEIGMLLSDIYQCAQNEGGTFKAVFPHDITKSECTLMLNYLARNKLPNLLEAGVPDGTEVAHKHGWVTYNGIMHSLGDAGIIYSPSGDYVLVIFLYHPTQLIWDSATDLVGQLSAAAYNFYNLPTR